MAEEPTTPDLVELVRQTFEPLDRGDDGIAGLPRETVPTT